MYWNDDECKQYMDDKCKAEQHISGDECNKYNDRKEHEDKHDKCHDSSEQYQAEYNGDECKKQREKEKHIKEPPKASITHLHYYTHSLTVQLQP